MCRKYKPLTSVKVFLNFIYFYHLVVYGKTDYIVNMSPLDKALMDLHRFTAKTDAQYLEFAQLRS